MEPIKVIWRSNTGTTAVSLTASTNGILLSDHKKTIATYTWNEVERFSFEDPQRTKVNVGAVLAFGALGLLASRKDYTLIYLNAGGIGGILEVQGITTRWKPWIDALLIEAPAARGKAFIGDTVPVDATTGVAAAVDIPDQIRKLADLHAEGILTDDEFTTKKAELLARM